MRVWPAAAPPKPLSVGELTHRIKDLLEGRFFNLWVEGELSHVNQNRSGHVYLTLKDEGARIECVIWRMTAENIRYRPRIGEKVLVFGRLTVYEPKGGYQLAIERLEPAGLGPMQAAFEALREKLGAEGLFDPARKRRWPLLPRAVGVVTSGTGAARRDIEAVVHRRSPQIPIVLYPAKVQGPGAALDIAAGIAAVAAHPRVDVVIVGRGGGSVEDLWAFNEEPVARAIAACPVPVISAVGHATDTTIADLVADLRTATPSEAAEEAVPVRDDLLQTLSARFERLDRATRHQVDHARKRLLYLERGLTVGLGFTDRELRVQRAVGALQNALQRQLTAHRQRAHAVAVRLRAQQPQARLARARQAIEQLTARLHTAAGRQLRAPRRRLGEAAVHLEALSPLRSLDRGYSITRHDGRVVRAHDEVDPGDTIEVLLHRGLLRATVDATEETSDE